MSYLGLYNVVNGAGGGIRGFKNLYFYFFDELSGIQMCFPNAVKATFKLPKILLSLIQVSSVSAGVIGNRSAFLVLKYNFSLGCQRVYLQSRVLWCGPTTTLNACRFTYYKNV